MVGCSMAAMGELGPKLICTMMVNSQHTHVQNYAYQ